MFSAFRSLAHGGGRLLTALTPCGWPRRHPAVAGNTAARSPRSISPTRSPQRGRSGTECLPRSRCRRLTGCLVTCGVGRTKTNWSLDLRFGVHDFRPSHRWGRYWGRARIAWTITASSVSMPSTPTSSSSPSRAGPTRITMSSSRRTATWGHKAPAESAATSRSQWPRSIWNGCSTVASAVAASGEGWSAVTTPTLVSRAVSVRLSPTVTVALAPAARFPTAQLTRP